MQRVPPARGWNALPCGSTLQRTARFHRDYFQMILGKLLGMIPTPSFTVMI